MAVEPDGGPVFLELTGPPGNQTLHQRPIRRVTFNVAIFVLAAFVEIAGRFGFRMSLRRGATPLIRWQFHFEPESTIPKGALASTEQLMVALASDSLAVHRLFEPFAVTHFRDIRVPISRASLSGIRLRFSSRTPRGPGTSP